MALPTNFSQWEHLQDTWRRVHNRRVREHFSDLAGVDEPWDPEIESPRGSLRVACMMQDADTAAMTNMRILLFWLVLGQASALHPPLYTMPTDRYQQSIKFAPQITLIFKEDLDEVEEGYSPLDAEISFRVMNESSQTMTEAKASVIAGRIRAEFALGGGYRWHKGRTKLSYRDKDNGYQFSINAYSEAEGKQVLNKVLDIQGDSLDLDLLSITTLGDTPPTVPPMERIYGEQRRTPRRRPVGWVRFAYADLHVHGLPNAITLVDRTGRRKNALTRA
jgi:hypothetical protein